MMHKQKKGFFFLSYLNFFLILYKKNTTFVLFLQMIFELKTTLVYSENINNSADIFYFDVRNLNGNFFGLILVIIVSTTNE